MSTFEDVGVVIHVLRVVRGLSQGDLARLSGVRNSSISNYERGKSVPKLETLERLAQGLELPVSAMEETQEFIRRMRNRAASGALESGPGGAWSLEAGRGDPTSDPTTLRSEMDRLSQDAGRVTTQILRLALGMLAPREDEPSDPGRSSAPEAAAPGTSDQAIPEAGDADHSSSESQSRGARKRS